MSVPLSALQRERARRYLLDFIVYCSPKLMRPDWMPELTQAITDAAHGIAVRGCFSTPPQSGKSLIVLHGLVWFAWNRPGTSSAYVTYGEGIMNEQSERCWNIAVAAGLQPTGNKTRIMLNNGSVIHFASFGGPIEGIPVDGLLFVDDAYKDRQAAWSAGERKSVEDKFFGTLLGRTHASSSVFVIGHRWSPFDLIQVTHDKLGYPYKNYQALGDDDRSFCERLKPTDFLVKMRDDIRAQDMMAWDAEWQGNPRPKGGTLFEKEYFYDALPFADPYREAHGVDLAYTEKARADWSVCVTGRMYFETLYITNVIRRQCKAEEFRVYIDRLKDQHPNTRFRWDGSTTEQGLAGVIGVDWELAKGKPYERAQPLAAAWNVLDKNGLPLLDRKGEPKRPRVLVPRSAPWLYDYLAEMLSFNGTGGHDDQVMATASLYALLSATLTYRVSRATEGAIFAQGAF